MKNVYMVQANYVYGKAIYLPYAVGVLAAYAWNDADIRASYELKRIIFSREDIDSAVASLDEPAVAAFSCYVWTYEYNKLFARKVKEKYPDCTVIFGGHQIPYDCAELDSLPFVDYLIHGEGEQAFLALLKALDTGADVSDIPQISHRGADGRPVLNTAFYPPLTDYVSPYTAGIFDKIVAENDYDFSALTETNRGCPYHCAYCDWGPLNSKMHFFPLEKVYADLDWIAEHKIEYMYCTDSNFGINERDEEIIAYLVELNKKTGYPQKFRSSYAKNSNMRVFRINKLLSERDMSKGVTLSYQSLSPEVLKNIGRENISFERFHELMALYNSANIPTFSEFIFAMPGETYDSLSGGFETLLTSGQHTSLYVYNCELLPNSTMGDRDYMKKHKIETIRTAFAQDHFEREEGDVDEYSHIIVSTSSMDRAMWREASVLSLCVQTFHSLGLLMCFAIYLHHECGTKYMDFYKSLLRWFDAHPETFSGALYREIYSSVGAFLDGSEAWHVVDPDFGRVNWPKDEYWFLRLAANRDVFYSEIAAFLADYGIEKDIFDEIMRYQSGVVKFPGGEPLTAQFRYDMHGYFSRILLCGYAPLEARHNTLAIPAEPENAAPADYARNVIWFGRRGGKTIHTAEVAQNFTE